MCSYYGQNNKILLQQLSKCTGQTAYESSMLLIYKHMCIYINGCVYVCERLIGHLSSATCLCFRLSSFAVVTLHNRNDREIQRCSSQWHTSLPTYQRCCSFPTSRLIVTKLFDILLIICQYRCGSIHCCCFTYLCTSQFVLRLSPLSSTTLIDLGTT